MNSAKKQSRTYRSAPSGDQHQSHFSRETKASIDADSHISHSSSTSGVEKATSRSLGRRQWERWNRPTPAKSIIEIEEKQQSFDCSDRFRRGSRTKTFFITSTITHSPSSSSRDLSSVVEKCHMSHLFGSFSTIVTQLLFEASNSSARATWSIVAVSNSIAQPSDDHSRDRWYYSTVSESRTDSSAPTNNSVASNPHENSPASENSKRNDSNVEIETCFSLLDVENLD